MQPARVDDCASGFFASSTRVMEYAGQVGESCRFGYVSSMAQHGVRHQSLVRVPAGPVCACWTMFATSWNVRCECEREW